MHADRTNRFMLGLIGLIALALGVGGLLAAGGVFGHHFQHRQLTSNAFARYVGNHGVWLWPAIAAVTLVLVLFALLWLLRLLFSTDRANGISIGKAGKKREDGQTAGRTTMTATALSQAVTAEIGTYHGVTNTKARMLGDPHHPTLAIEVTASRRAELRPLIERIESQAIAHARTALEQPNLPVKLDIAINDKTVSRTH
jgi:hypothetical protein